MIGTLRESSLHAALKRWYARPGDRFEQPLAGWVIDLVRPGESGDLLIEFQTGNFAGLRPKLRALAAYPLRLVHPVAARREIVRVSADGEILSRRQSPRHGRVEHVFEELIYIPEDLLRPNFALEVLLIEEEQHWQDDGRGSWRRGHWSVAERHLSGVQQSRTFASADDYLALLPPGLPRPFSNRDLSGALHIPAVLAGKMTYTLRAAGLLAAAGKRGREGLFVLAASR